MSKSFSANDLGITALPSFRRVLRTATGSGSGMSLARRTHNDEPERRPEADADRVLDAVEDDLSPQLPADRCQRIGGAGDAQVERQALDDGPRKPEDVHACVVGEAGMQLGAEGALGVRERRHDVDGPGVEERGRARHGDGAGLRGDPVAALRDGELGEADRVEQVLDLGRHRSR